MPSICSIVCHQVQLQSLSPRSSHYGSSNTTNNELLRFSNANKVFFARLRLTGLKENQKVYGGKKKELYHAVKVWFKVYVTYLTQNLLGIQKKNSCFLCCMLHWTVPSIHEGVCSLSRKTFLISPQSFTTRHNLVSNDLLLTKNYYYKLSLVNRVQKFSLQCWPVSISRKKDLSFVTHDDHNIDNIIFMYAYDIKYSYANIS